MTLSNNSSTISTLSNKENHVKIHVSWYRPQNCLFDTIFVIWVKMGKLLLISVHDKLILPFLGIIRNQHITG